MSHTDIAFRGLILASVKSAGVIDTLPKPNFMQPSQPRGGGTGWQPPKINDTLPKPNMPPAVPAPQMKPAPLPPAGPQPIKPVTMGGVSK